MKKICAILLALLTLAALAAGCAKRDGQTATDAAEQMRVTFIDVGKGDCILLEKDGVFALIDAGYEDTSDDVISFLKKQGEETLDAFIVTHYDKDHVGGAAAVAQAFAVKQGYLPGYTGHSKYYTALMKAIVERDLTYRQVTEDVSFTLSDVTVDIFASSVEYVYDGTEEGNDNDASLVISAVYGQDSYLFAGDLEKAGVSAFLAADRGTYDVVKMPHHGNAKKNTDDFIEAVRPKIAVITDGADDPAEEKTLNLLAQAGAKTYRTAEIGTITVISEGSGTYTVN